MYLLSSPQVAEKEGEMVNLNKKLASLSGGMAEGRSQLDQLEREEGKENDGVVV